MSIETEDAARRTLFDAELLLRQYEQRNHAEQALDAEQRKAWAAEMVQVMQALSAELRARLPEDYSVSRVAEQWNSQMRDGTRPVTFKLRR